MVNAINTFKRVRDESPTHNDSELIQQSKRACIGPSLASHSSSKIWKKIMNLNKPSPPQEKGKLFKTQN